MLLKGLLIINIVFKYVIIYYVGGVKYGVNYIVNFIFERLIYGFCDVCNYIINIEKCKWYKYLVDYFCL